CSPSLLHPFPTRRSSDLLAQLAQHATQRSQLLAAQQLSPDREGLATLAKRDAEAGAPLMETGDQLAALIEQCQAANQRNGRLIRSEEHTSELQSRENIVC